MKKDILIIAYSLLHRDPRILRQIEAFKNNYHLQTIGYSSSNVNDVVHFNIPEKPKIKIRKYLNALRILTHQYKKTLYSFFSIKKLLEYDYKEPDLIVANDWDGLFLAGILVEKKHWKSKIYFDAHEYSPKEFDTLKWKVFFRPLINYVLKKMRNRFAVMSTVCPSLARMYETYFHFKPHTVYTVTNATSFEKTLLPAPVLDKIKLIHHGAAMPARQLETMIDMMQFLPSEKYELFFMLVKTNNVKYYDTLVNRAKNYSNIHFLEPVLFNKIPSYTNQFDIGVYILNNAIINNKYALPNKFFEFIQARLAIAVGDSFEMRQYIQKYNLGIAAEKNDACLLAKKILSLSTADIMRFKENAHKYAQKLSAEKNITLLQEIAKVALS